MTTSTPRQTKTPRQRAEEAVELAERRWARANDALLKATRAKSDAQAEYDDATTRLDYVKQDPALANPAASTTDTAGGHTA